VGPRAGLNGRKISSHRDSILDRPARSQSLYRLSCPAHIYIYIFSMLRFLNVLVCVSNAVAQWLRCSATNQKVAVSIPAGVIGFFIDIKSFRSHYGPGIDSASNRNE